MPHAGISTRLRPTFTPAAATEIAPKERRAPRDRQPRRHDGIDAVDHDCERQKTDDLVGSIVTRRHQRDELSREERERDAQERENRHDEQQRLRTYTPLELLILRVERKDVGAESQVEREHREQEDCRKAIRDRVLHRHRPRLGKAGEHDSIDEPDEPQSNPGRNERQAEREHSAQLEARGTSAKIGRGGGEAVDRAQHVPDEQSRPRCPARRGETPPQRRAMRRPLRLRPRGTRAQTARAAT